MKIFQNLKVVQKYKLFEFQKKGKDDPSYQLIIAWFLLSVIKQDNSKQQSNGVRVGALQPNCLDKSGPSHMLASDLSELSETQSVHLQKNSHNTYIMRFSRKLKSSFM